MKHRGQELLDELNKIIEMWVKQTYITNKINAWQQQIRNRRKLGHVTPYRREKVSNFIQEWKNWLP